MPTQTLQEDDTDREWLLSELVAAVEKGSLQEAREAVRRSFEQKKEACLVLQAALEDLADERGDDPATLKLLSHISERAHSEAGSAECWPRAGQRHDREDPAWLPIVPVRSVTLDEGGSFVEGMALDEALLVRHLSEHSWCVLRLEVPPGDAFSGVERASSEDDADLGNGARRCHSDGLDGAAVLAGALEDARQESGRFFQDLPERRKRELTELPGGDRARKGSGYRDTGEGREHFHMAARGWHTTQPWPAVERPSLRPAAERAFSLLEGVCLAVLKVCCRDVAGEMVKQRAGGGVGEEERKWDASVLDAFRYRAGDGAGRMVLGDHVDPGLLTVEACPDALGLEVFDPAAPGEGFGAVGAIGGAVGLNGSKCLKGGGGGGRWVRAEAVLRHGTDLIVMPGEQLQRATASTALARARKGSKGSGVEGGGAAVMPAALHRVRWSGVERLALAFEMRRPYLEG